jgi:hypothetical protein
MAEEQQDETLLADAHLVVGVLKMWSNDMPSAVRHIDLAVEYGNAARPDLVRLRVGPDPRVLSRVVSGLVTWMAGSPDQARARVELGLALSKEMAHPYSVCYGLFHAGLLDLWAQDLESLTARMEELLALAGRHDYPIWRALARVLRGVAYVARGDHDDGLEEVEEGFALYGGLSTPPVFWPALLTIRARAHLMAGRLGSAASFIEAAERAVTAEDPLIPEIAITRGDVHLADRPPDRVAGEKAYESALLTARANGLRMSELEAATRLTALRLGTPREEESRKDLRVLVDAFTEGLMLPQLRAASSLLRR